MILLSKTRAQGQIMQQSEHLSLGEINTLLIDRDTPHGMFLHAQDEKDVLLPGSYIKDTMKIGDLIDVFLYTDSEDRLVATTLSPKAKLGEFGFFEVVDTTKFGAFVDWGLPKDLFVPKIFQKAPFVVGDKKFLRVIYDEMTHRLVATEKISKYLNNKPKDIRIHQEVKALIIDKTPLGFKAIVNDIYEGLFFHNEIFETLEIGMTKQAFIKNIRKDGGIDLSLRKIGGAKTKTAVETIVELLDANKGILPYNYKSAPELIQEVFAMSKKDFKRSLTTLQEKNIIEVKDTGIYKKI